MNKNKNEKFKVLIEKLDQFENQFKTIPENELLVSYFEEIFATIKENNFIKNLNQLEVKQLYKRLIMFQKMFANKKEQLKMDSVNLLKTENSIGRYIINSKL